MKYVYQGKSVLHNEIMKLMPGTSSVYLEASEVDYGGAGLIRILLADLHLLDGGV